MYRTIYLHIKEISHVPLMMWLHQNRMEDPVEGSFTKENGTNVSVSLFPVCKFQTVLTMALNNVDCSVLGLVHRLVF
jgi:hypothetical protein